MLNWFRRGQQERFDAAWEPFLERGVWQYRFLDASQRERVRRVVAHLVRRKRWVGGSGFKVTDEMRVVIAGVSALMTVGLETPFLFPKLRSIILYPNAYRDPEPDEFMGLLRPSDPWVEPRLGEAWQNGPVLLSWRAAQRQARVRGRGRNVVLHEMAHHLDGYDGQMDGMPHFDSREDRRRWYAVTDEEYHRLVGHARRSEVTLLDHYGATNQAEFFAVATECFFERPHAMRQRHAELFALLAKFYYQDPTGWIPAGDPPPAPPPAKAPRRARGARKVQQANLDHLGLGQGDELFARGVLMLGREEYAEAARLFTAVLEHDAEDSEAYQHRGEARLELEDYRGALVDSQAALERDPSDERARWVAAVASIELGDDAAAVTVVDRLLRDNREDGQAWFLKGRLHARAGEMRRAIEAFRKVIRFDPLDAEAHLCLAQCLEQANDLRAAQRHRERASQLDPSLDGESYRF